MTTKTVQPFDAFIKAQDARAEKLKVFTKSYPEEDDAFIDILQWRVACLHKLRQYDADKAIVDGYSQTFHLAYDKEILKTLEAIKDIDKANPAFTDLKQWLEERINAGVTTIA